jgi:hypothetical protein
MPAEDPLRRELSVFHAHKHDWLSTHTGEFVVIAGDRVEGFYLDYEAAWDAGVKAFGLQTSFLIKQIFETEPVYGIYLSA